MPLNRRKFLKQSAIAAASLTAPPFLARLSAADAPAAPSATPVANTTIAAAPPAAPVVIYPPAPAPVVAPANWGVMDGPFQPTWESLAAYKSAPDWFRDAKFGMWAHWGPQCVPEQGDWYAQHMYIEGHPQNKFHVATYGHPSKFGFKDVVNLFKAEKWDPDYLIGLYKRAGARYFMAMAVHHDNFDMFDSTYQPWNSLNVGPKKSLVGGWEKAVRAAGLKFAVSSHGDRAWSWYQAAQGADKTGPLAGVRYDGLLRKADGKGLWWDGLDPQDYYAQYHPLGNYDWPQNARGDSPPLAKAYSEKFFNRTIDLINKHNPDLLYFDDTVLPIYPSTDVGLRIAAYYYNHNLKLNGGKLDVVLTGKGLNPQQSQALVMDIERGGTGAIRSEPWQTDTCIGDWHYNISHLNKHSYKTARDIARMLVDNVSKNGNLMLNIPLTGHGMPDSDELGIIADFTKWMDQNSEGIYATRPWKVYGEGVSSAPAAGNGIGRRRGGPPPSYTAKDFRFMQKDQTLYAFVMDWPVDGNLVIKSLADGAPTAPGKVERVEMLGVTDPLKFTRDANGLNITLPAQKVGDYVYGFKISGDGLTT
jgi:alpha-L-fucosidase